VVCPAQCFGGRGLSAQIARHSFAVLRSKVVILLQSCQLKYGSAKITNTTLKLPVCLRGILLRFRHLCWPGGRFSLSHDSGVCHSTQAARGNGLEGELCASNTLPCPSEGRHWHVHLATTMRAGEVTHLAVVFRSKCHQSRQSKRNGMVPDSSLLFTVKLKMDI
jgi:hypothetical protein